MILFHNRESPEAVQSDEKSDEENKDPMKKIWSQDTFATEYRKFNIDMTPKVINFTLFIFQWATIQFHHKSMCSKGS